MQTLLVLLFRTTHDNIHKNKLGLVFSSGSFMIVVRTFNIDTCTVVDVIFIFFFTAYVPFLVPAATSVISSWMKHMARA